MADHGREPRPSTDEEHAPLLRDANGAHHELTWGERISSTVQEPLSALTKLLLILALFLLLLSSVFIGLFAGSQYKLKNGKASGPAETVSVTVWPPTATVTATSVSTKPVTSTAISIATTTATSTQITTTTQTKTKTKTLPIPTGIPDSGKLCLTPECIKLSASILSSIDTSVDPCENFYDFANGGWIKEHPLPADKGRYGNFEALATKNKQLIRELLESMEVPSLTDDSSYDEQILKKLRGLYGSCMDEDYLNQAGEEPLKKVVRTIRRLYNGDGKDSLLDDAEKKRKRLTAALAYLHSRGVTGLFDFSVDGDVGVDPNDMTLWFSQPDLGLPSKEYYEDEDIVDLYKNTIRDLLVAVSEDDNKHDTTTQQSITTSDGQNVLREHEENVWPPWPWPPWEGDDEDNRKPIDAKHMAKHVVRFERKLAEASLDLDILYQDPYGTYNPMPISRLERVVRQIDFGDYFATFTPRAYPERVIVTYPAYLRSLADILDETRADVVEAYLVTRAALSLAPHLGQETRAWRAQRALVERLQGIKKGAIGDRSEYCIGQVESSMGFAAGRYFVNATFGGDSREKGTKVITDIIKAFKKSLDHIEWMDKKSAKAAAEKADALRVKVGFPLSPDTRSSRSIAFYYNIVNIERHDFFGNMLSAQASDEYKKWQKLGKRRNPEEWEMWPSMVNAYFNPPANEIVFPAGIMQPPFFAQDWPGYLAYGSFGQVAAHELTHAFDSAGRLYNQNGKLEEWWTNATSKGFQTRQDCLAKQYSSYYVLDDKGNKVYVNGNLTSGENIGDTGVIQSYRAWKAQYADSLDAGNEYILPGLNYTHEQLFFVSFARAWAQNIKPAAAVQRVRTDPHSPNNFRVDGTVFNVPEFAEAFKCSSKAKLNPPQEKRCILW